MGYRGYSAGGGNHAGGGPPWPRHRGLALVAELGETFFEAPLLRLKARCLSGKGGTEVAALFAQAEQVAHGQGAVAWH